MSLSGEDLGPSLLPALGHTRSFQDLTMPVTKLSRIFPEVFCQINKLHCLMELSNMCWGQRKIRGGTAWPAAGRGEQVEAASS